LVLTMVVFLLLAWFLWKDMDWVRSRVASSGWVGLVIIVGIYGILGASPIPSEPLTLLLSPLVGPFLTTIIAGSGNLLAALVEYSIGDKVGTITDFEARREKLPLGLGRLPVNSPAFLIFARMLPYTAKVVSLLGGIYGVSLWRYTWTTAVSTFFGAAMVAYGGFGLFHIVKVIWPNFVR
jgi:uncharacterized membrane protein YdjX (TVP38/TMEM64 family)